MQASSTFTRKTEMRSSSEPAVFTSHGTFRFTLVPIAAFAFFCRYNKMGRFLDSLRMCPISNSKTAHKMGKVVAALDNTCNKAIATVSSSFGPKVRYLS